MDEEESLDVGESIAITENADRMVGLTVNNELVEQAWGAIPPPIGEPCHEEPVGWPDNVRRINGYMSTRWADEATNPWVVDRGEMLTFASEPTITNTITIEGYVRQEKYDELVEKFNALSEKVNHLEEFLSTVSPQDEEILSI